MGAREVHRYFHLQGVDLAESSPLAQRVKVGGLWEWIPKSVIHGQTRRHGESGTDELVIDEWFAKKKGWA